MKISKTGIYVDGYELRKVLKRAQFAMTKADRIIYGTPILQECGEFLAAFVMAYDFPEERAYYIKKMCSAFEVMKMDLRIIVEDNILKCGSQNDVGMSTDALKIHIFELIGKIDDGVGKWRSSVKGKMATD